jgi:hypothetical protein
MLHDIKISSNPGMPTQHGVEIDGEQFKFADAVKFEIKADHWAHCEIGFLSQAFAYEGKAAVSVDEVTAALLVKLGWTPPS